MTYRYIQLFSLALLFPQRCCSSIAFHGISSISKSLFITASKKITLAINVGCIRGQAVQFVGEVDQNEAGDNSIEGHKAETRGKGWNVLITRQVALRIKVFQQTTQLFVRPHSRKYMEQLMTVPKNIKLSGKHSLGKVTHIKKCSNEGEDKLPTVEV